VGRSEEEKMTRDEIVLMARKADLWLTSDERWAAVVRFTNLVAAAERESIAAWVASQRNDVPATGSEISAAIRARGEK
jgi:hypothetical protein